MVIPAEMNKQPVRATGNEAFAENQLTSASIPDGVSVIGDSAFDGCLTIIRK